MSRLSRGWVAARRAAIAVCRAADAAGHRVARCRGVLRGVEGGSPPITPPSRAGRHPSRRRRGLSRGVAGVAGHIISVKTATCTWTPIGGEGGKLHGRLRANTSTLQRSPRVPPQLQFSNLRLTGPEGRNSERAVVYPPTFTSGACGRKTSPLNGPFESRLPVLLVLLESNSKDYNSFEKRLRRDFSKGLFTAIMHCSTILYTATIHILYSPRK